MVEIPNITEDVIILDSILSEKIIIMITNWGFGFSLGFIEFCIANSVIGHWSSSPATMFRGWGMPLFEVEGELVLLLGPLVQVLSRGAWREALAIAFWVRKTW